MLSEHDWNMVSGYLEIAAIARTQGREKDAMFYETVAVRRARWSIGGWGN